jgi:hypothetical protein
MKSFFILTITTSIQKLFRSIRLDRLAPFFSRFSLSVRVFFSGQLCGTSGDHASKMVGHLHVLRSGTLTILQPDKPATVVSEPTVLLLPRPGQHTFRSEAADILCAFVEFGAGMLNPLAAALPHLLVVPVAGSSILSSTVDLLFAEAFDQKMAGRLCFRFGHKPMSAPHGMEGWEGGWPHSWQFPSPHALICRMDLSRSTLSVIAYRT